jgi:gluconate 2-dehydrogenase gamma chain
MFFTKDEYAFISAAVSRLIPADELGPGALEAGVPEYIDRQMQTPYGVAANWYMQGPFLPDGDPLFGYQLPLKPAEIYRLGIVEAEVFCRQKYGASFVELSPEHQDDALKHMESGWVEFIKVPSTIFFDTLLQNTREGFFSDPIHGGNKGLVGWKLIGFPGARADYMDWVGRNEPYPYPPVSISGERG